MQDFIDFKYGEEAKIPGFYLKEESSLIIDKLINEIIDWIRFDEVKNKDLIEYEFLKSLLEEILYNIEQNGSIHSRLSNDANDLYINIRKNYSSGNILIEYLLNSSNFEEAFESFYEKILSFAEAPIQKEYENNNDSLEDSMKCFKKTEEVTKLDEKKSYDKIKTLIKNSDKIIPGENSSEEDIFKILENNISILSIEIERLLEYDREIS